MAQSPQLDATQAIEKTTYFEQMGTVGIILTILIIFATIICFLIVRNQNTPIVRKVARMSHSAYGHLLLAGLSIFWASCVSVFGTSLQEQWFAGATWKRETLFFGVSVILALIVGVLHYIRAQRKEAENQARPCVDAINENSSQCINMSDIVNTCIFDLDKIIRIENAKQGSVLGKKRKYNKYNRTLDNAISTCLESVLKVTKKFSEGADELHIKANIFNLVPSHSAKTSFEQNATHKQDNNSIFSKDAILNSPFFLFGTNLQSRLEHCDYILVCEQTMTCQLDKKDIFSKCYDHNKTNHHPLCMPFSYTKQTSDLRPNHPNLFGAPETVESKRECYVEDLMKSLDKHLDNLDKSAFYSRYMNENFKLELKNYYEQDQDRPKSILSIPIGKMELTSTFPKIPTESEQIACILNIYVNKINFLENSMKSESYHALTKQLCHSLSILISLKIMYSSLLNDYNNDNKVTSKNNMMLLQNKVS